MPLFCPILSEWSSVSLLLVGHLDAVASGEQFELVHGDCLLAAEVPPHQIFELPWSKLESAALDQPTEVLDGNLLCILVLNAVEESLQELIVLLLVRVLVRIGCVECAHQLAELVLVDLVWLAIRRIRAQVVHERVVEALLSGLVVRRVDRPCQELFDEESDSVLGCSANDWDVIVRTEVED